MSFQLLVLSERSPNGTSAGRFLMSDEGVCLDAPTARAEAEAAAESTVRFQACAGDPRQRWRLDGLSLVHVESGQCLTRPEGGTSDQLTVTACGRGGGGGQQQWRFEDIQWREGERDPNLNDIL